MKARYDLSQNIELEIFLDTGLDCSLITEIWKHQKCEFITLASCKAPTYCPPHLSVIYMRGCSKGSLCWTIGR